MIELSTLGEREFKNQIIRNGSLVKKREQLETKLDINQNQISAINVLVKKLFEKYINDKISEGKFYELDKSYDEEKQEVNDAIKVIKDDLSMICKRIDDITKFYEMVSKYEEITELRREDIVKLIDKIVVREEKGKNKRRLVEVYYVLVGKM